MSTLLLLPSELKLNLAGPLVSAIATDGGVCACTHMPPLTLMLQEKDADKQRHMLEQFDQRAWSTMVRILPAPTVTLLCPGHRCPSRARGCEAGRTHDVPRLQVGPDSGSPPMPLSAACAVPSPCPPVRCRHATPCSGGTITA